MSDEIGFVSFPPQYWSISRWKYVNWEFIFSWPRNYQDVGSSYLTGSPGWCYLEVRSVAQVGWEGLWLPDAFLSCSSVTFTHQLARNILESPLILKCSQRTHNTRHKSWTMCRVTRCVAFSHCVKLITQEDFIYSHSLITGCFSKQLLCNLLLLNHCGWRPNQYFLTVIALLVKQ